MRFNSITEIEKDPKFPGLSYFIGLRRLAEWWAHQDSNLEPKDYESSALTIELWARRWIMADATAT
jgi:hypothetical protein